MDKEKIPFYSIFIYAFRASISQKLAWGFGLLVASVSVFVAQINWVLESSFPFFDEYAFTIFPERIYNEVSLIFLWLGLTFVVGVFGKGNLISVLSYIVGKSNSENYPNGIHALKKNFFRAFAVEGLALLSSFIAAAIILTPLVVASGRNPAVINLLITLGLLTFIPILIAVFFVKQYSLFYFLLSPVTLRGAIESSCVLFSRFFSRGLSFGFFFVLITLLFTFCLQLIILGIVWFAQNFSVPVKADSVLFAVNFIFWTWFAVFEQALWLYFFKSIVTTREMENVTEEKKESETLTANIPEMPPVKNYSDD